MTDNTKLRVIDAVHQALDSHNNEKLLAARYLVQSKCYQSGIDVLAFLFNDVFPIYTGAEPSKIVECPYCDKKDIKGEFGLRTHVSRIHKNKFLEFKQQYL